MDGAAPLIKYIGSIHKELSTTALVDGGQAQEVGGISYFLALLFGASEAGTAVKDQFALLDVSAGVGGIHLVEIFGKAWCV